MENRMKFGLVGCGRVSENHLTALTSGVFPSQLIAVADIDEAKAKAKAEKYQVPYYTDYHRMMKAHPEIAVVNIATPTGHHASHVVDLARYGKHLIVEKPMSLSVRDCERMIHACERHGGRLFVVQQNRFNPAIVAARAALDAGRFGKLVLGTVRVRWRRTQEYYENDDWHGTWALDGGVMSQQASHYLDMLQWFMGPVERIQCRAATRLLDIEVEDTAVALLTFESGALGAFEATVATRPEDLEGSLSLLGERGSVIVGGHAMNKILYWRFTEEQPGDAEIRDRHSESIANVYGRGHTPFLAHVAACIRDGRPCGLDAEEGKKNIRILTALYESAARQGAAVKPGCAIRRSRLGKAARPA